MSSVETALTEILETARSRGFLGPGAVAPHLMHARGFLEAVERELGGPASTFADLGSGGGVPGLVLTVAWPQARGVLVESASRRAEALRDALARIGAVGRVEVIEARAEVAAHRPELRERFQAVVARSFAGPAATAEIAAGFTALGGVLVVSEPPGGDASRWPSEQLERIGFGRARIDVGAHGAFAVMRKKNAAPLDVPRGVGRPTKRPLW